MQISNDLHIFRTILMKLNWIKISTGFYNFRLLQVSPEESEDQLLIVIKEVLVLGLQLADERLAAGVHVHLGDEGEETLGGRVIGNVTAATLELGSAVA